VRRWAAQRFNLGTLALAFSGEPPSQLDLPLPDGARVDPPTPEPIRDLTTPSVFAYSHDGGVWATLTAERSYAASAALWTLRRRLNHRLRGRRTLSYDITVDPDPITPQQLHVFVHADCLPQNQDAVAATVVASLDELATNGPTALELEEYVAERERQDANDAFLPEALFWHANEAAYGEPFRSTADVSAGMRAVSHTEAADALRLAMPTLLLGIAAGGSVPGGRFTRYPTDSGRRVEGRRYRRRGLPVIGRKENERELVVGPDGVTLVGDDDFFGEKYVRSVFFGKLAAAIYFEESVIQLYGLDGHEIVVDPAIWRRSGELSQTLEESIPKDLVVDLRGEAPSFTDDDLAAGEAAFDEGDWARAIPLLAAGLEREPESPDAWGLLGAAQLGLQNRTAAAESARKAVALDPEHIDARRLLANALMQLGHNDEAVEHIRKLLELEPGELLTLESAVFLLIAASFEREAVGIAGRAVELFPNDVESHNAHGWAAQALGEFTEARASLERAIALEPASVVHNNLGWVLLQMGEAGPALAQFDRALQLDTSNIYAAANRPLALQILGRRDESAQALRAWSDGRLEKHQATLELDPLDADALRHRTLMLWNLGRDDEALSAARDATERLPEDAVLWRSLAQVELVAGNVERAEDSAEKALTLDSETFDSVDFAAWYGAYAEGVKARERSSTAAKEALERRPDSTRAWADAGYGAVAAGNYADAVASFDRAIRRKPLDCCHHAGRALAHLASGDRAQAERDLSQAGVLSSDRCRDALIVKARMAAKALA
jgi:tetratricopeptide (TPR) repeat protein